MNRVTPPQPTPRPGGDTSNLEQTWIHTKGNQGRERSTNPNVWVRISSGGVGVLHVKGVGAKKFGMSLETQEKTNFLARDGILPGYRVDRAEDGTTEVGTARKRHVRTAFSRISGKIQPNPRLNLAKIRLCALRLYPPKKSVFDFWPLRKLIPPPPPRNSHFT